MSDEPLVPLPARDSRTVLIELADQDRMLRTELVASGELHGGLHPRMVALLDKNAARLAELLDTGWPGTDQVGTDGEQAAWLIAQHAIGQPTFMRRCRDLLDLAVRNGTAPGWQLAMLTDRIRVNEGRPQVHGTQFDWDDAGNLSPLPIEDAQNVDARRREIGLEPIAKATERHRGNARAELASPPADLAAYRAEQQEWAQRVGWR